MVLVADASVAIDADMSKFSKGLKSGLDKAETQTGSLGKKLNTALSPQALVGGLAGGFAATQVVSFFADATQKAGVFQDTVAATGVIFTDEFTPALEAWADEAHSAFGASKQDALDAANQIAVFGKSAGLAGQELVDFSTEMVQLGGDLASMFGGSTQDAITAVGAALRGESEPIRRYGVLLDDATLRQKAFEMGLISTTKNALTPQQRVLAAHAEIMAQTGDAQGDFARTSDGLMNTQRDLAASFENLQIEIGEKLLPAMTALSRWALEQGIPALEKLIEVTGSVVGVVQRLYGAIPEGEADPFANLKARFGDAATGMTQEWAEAWSRMAGVPGEAGVPEASADALADGAGVVADGAETGLEEPIEEATDRQIEQATNAARALTAAYAGELADGADTVETAMGVITQGLEDEQTKAQRIAEAKAFLTSTALRDALNSEDPYLKLAAIEQREIVEGELEALATNAQYQAYLTGTSVPTAIRDNHAAAATAAQVLRRNVVAELKFNAYEIGQTGGETWARGVAAGIANEEWRVSQKVDDILDYLLLAGSPPFTKAKEAAEGVAKTYMSTLSKGLQDSRLGKLTAGLLPSSSAASYGFGVSSQTMAGEGGGRTITVNVIDAGVAASVGDIARGLREFEDTGMLP